MLVQALGPELAVEGLDIGVIHWLSGPGEVQDDTPLIGPQIEVARHEFGAVVDPDRLRIADLMADPLLTDDWTHDQQHHGARRLSGGGRKRGHVRRTLVDAAAA